MNVGAGLPRDSLELHIAEEGDRGVNPLLQIRESDCRLINRLLEVK